MVRQINKKEINHKQQKDDHKKINKHLLKRLTGRPPKSQEQRIHQTCYSEVKTIILTISILCEKFKAKNTQPVKIIQIKKKYFSPLFEQSFNNLILNQNQRLKYGNKNFILFWLHYLSKNNKVWRAEQLLNLILVWFSYQGVLTKSIYQKCSKWIQNQTFKIQLFSDNNIDSMDQINLFVVLAIEIAAFENIQIVERVQHDLILQNKQNQIVASVRQFSVIMGYSNRN